MRGGGTSQAGQAIGEGIQVDTSKYYNRVLEVNAGRALGARRAGHRAGRTERATGAAGAALRAGHFHRQPRHHRRHDGQQFERRAQRALRQDHRSRAGADGRAVGWQHRAFPRDSARAKFRLATRWKPRAIAPCCAWPPSTRTRSTGAIRRSCAASAATTSTNLPMPSKPVNLAKIMVGSEGTLGVVLEAEAAAGPAAEGESRDGDRVRATCWNRWPPRP